MEKDENNLTFCPKKAEAEKFYNRGSYEMAFRLYLELAETKDPSVFFMLGNMYHYGLGTLVNFEKALVYYKMAAEKKEMRARCCLALMYYKGEGVKKDLLIAKRLLDADAEVDIRSL